MNKTLGNRLLPDTKYLLFKYFDTGRDPVFHIKCPKCSSNLKYSGSNKTKEISCSNCGSVNIGRCSVDYITFSLQHELTEIVNRNMAKLCFPENRESEFPITDVLDAQWHASIFKKYGPFLSVFLNTDGVQTFNASKKSLWPIFVVLNNLPRVERFRIENVLCLGFYYGEKVSLEDFLESFIEDIDYINAGPGIFTDQHGNLKVFCVGASLDSVAKPKLINMKLFNGYESCPYCEILGIRCNHSMKFPFG